MASPVAPSAPASSTDLWSALSSLRTSQHAAAASAAAAAPTRTDDTTVVFMGAQGSGKSTLWSQYLGKQGAPAFAVQPDTLLDYKLARMPAPGGGNSNGISSSWGAVAHFWEVGGGRRMASLLEHAITEENVASIHIFILVDVSKPLHVVEHAAFWIEKLRARIHAVFTALSAKHSPLPARLVAATQAHFASHPDRPALKPLPLPVTLLATRYDSLLASAAALPDRARLPLAFLRAVAHRAGCGLAVLGGPAGATVPALKARAAGRVGTAVTDAFSGPALAPGQDSAAAITAAGVPAAALAAGTEALLTAYAGAVARVLVAGEEAEPAERAAGGVPALKAERAVDAAVAAAEEEVRRAERQAALVDKVRQAERAAAAATAAASTANNTNASAGGTNAGTAAGVNAVNKK